MWKLWMMDAYLNGLSVLFTLAALNEGPTDRGRMLIGAASLFGLLGLLWYVLGHRMMMEAAEDQCCKGEDHKCKTCKAEK